MRKKKQTTLFFSLQSVKFVICLNKWNRPIKNDGNKNWMFLFINFLAWWLHAKMKEPVAWGDSKTERKRMRERDRK